MEFNKPLFGDTVYSNSGDQFVQVRKKNKDSLKVPNYIIMAAKTIMISREKNGVILL